MPPSVRVHASRPISRPERVVDLCPRCRTACAGDAYCSSCGLWAIGAVAARRASGRTAATLVQAVGLLVGILLVAVAGVENLGSVLVSLPLGVAMLVLLWVPASSRRWFAEGPATEVLVLPRRHLEAH